MCVIVDTNQLASESRVLGKVKLPTAATVPSKLPGLGWIEANESSGISVSRTFRLGRYDARNKLSQQRYSQEACSHKTSDVSIRNAVFVCMPKAEIVPSLVC